MSTQFRWAEALKVEQVHGDAAPAFIAERIRTLAIEGDLAGMHRWHAIAACYEQLIDAGGRQ